MTSCYPPQERVMNGAGGLKVLVNLYFLFGVNSNCLINQALSYFINLNFYAYGKT